MTHNRLRLFHTADWHLGQNFYHHDRFDEHAHFLKFLLEQIEKRRPDVLIVAGDIFDTSNPPQLAQQQYYEFLAQLACSPLQHVLIVAGNHDSPRLIEAPRDILAALSIRVVGFAPANPAACVIPLTDKRTNQPLAWLGAVPFLRDADVRRSFEAESFNEASQRLVAGIADYYARVGDALAQAAPPEVPRIVTGHLFAAGLDFDTSEEIIHVGNSGRVPAATFPPAAYVALGHIHRAQAVGRQEHIRYSGSPIPLSFDEADQPKQIVEIDFEGPELVGLNPIAIPASRRLLRIEADSCAALTQALEGLAPRHTPLPDWLEVTLSRPPESTYWREELNETAERFGAELLHTRLTRATATTNWNALDSEADFGLEQLDPESVLAQLYRNNNPDQELPDELRLAFLELIDEIKRDTANAI